MILFYRAEISNEQREKEARLEAEADRLRFVFGLPQTPVSSRFSTECAAKEDAVLAMQRELQQLREYKEKNDVEVLGFSVYLYLSFNMKLIIAGSGDGVAYHAREKCTFGRGSCRRE